MFDLENNTNILGGAKQDKEGLYYIEDNQKCIQEPFINSEKSIISSMRAIVKRG